MSKQAETKVFQLFKNQSKVQAEAQSQPKIVGKEDVAGVEVTQFIPRDLRKELVVNPDSSNFTAKVGNPFEDLKGNIQKLEHMHSKLKFMLNELETLIVKK
jgi:hypothetical protein